MRNLSTIALVCSLFTTCSVAQAENPKDFVLKSVLDETQFKLSENGGKTVVLHFLLKTECPLCLKYTRDYAQLAAKSSDVVHLFIKPDSVDEIKGWASHLNKATLKEAPKIYRDPDAKLASQFSVPDGYSFHGQSIHFPALVALDGSGKEMFRYVGKSNRDRMAIKDFRAKLQDAKK